MRRNRYLVTAGLWGEAVLSEEAPPGADELVIHGTEGELRLGGAIEAVDALAIDVDQTPYTAGGLASYAPAAQVAFVLLCHFLSKICDGGNVAVVVRSDGIEHANDVADALNALETELMVEASPNSYLGQIELYSEDLDMGNVSLVFALSDPAQVKAFERICEERRQSIRRAVQQGLKRTLGDEHWRWIFGVGTQGADGEVLHDEERATEQYQSLIQRIDDNHAVLQARLDSVIDLGLDSKYSNEAVAAAIAKAPERRRQAAEHVLKGVTGESWDALSSETRDELMSAELEYRSLMAGEREPQQAAAVANLYWRALEREHDRFRFRTELPTWKVFKDERGYADHADQFTEIDLSRMRLYVLGQYRHKGSLLGSVAREARTQRERR